MSTTIRVSIQDKERLAKLARRIKDSTLSEALRTAIELAEHNDEKFEGHQEELRRTLKHASSGSQRVSMNADEELAKTIR